MRGRRMDDARMPRHQWPPGAYGRVKVDGEWVWCCTTPSGDHGDLSQHEVTEHEDGTITVSPSILVRGGPEMQTDLWHGWLERGVWREG